LQVPLQQSVPTEQGCVDPLQHLLLAPHVRPSPVQQSAFVLQLTLTLPQPQVFAPLLHSPPQQSVPVLHAEPFATQPHLPIELQRGLGPQQSAALTQLAPVAAQPHLDVTESHTPPQH
jgi:hypothetical protein